MKLELQDLKLIQNLLQEDESTQLPQFHYQKQIRRKPHSRNLQKRSQKILKFKLITIITTAIIAAGIMSSLFTNHPTEIEITNTYKIGIK
jgi:hypothetical protein